MLFLPRTAHSLEWRVVQKSKKNYPHSPSQLLVKRQTTLPFISPQTRSPAMSSGEVPNDPKPIELKDDSDFEKGLSSDRGLGLLSICDVGSLFSDKDSKPIELKDESDFEKVISCDGDLSFLSICGFGSLLSERSARSTFPNLINFRVARLNGFRRVFAHVAPIFFERGIAKPETMEISSLSVEPCEGETLIVTVFEIQRSEIPSFIKREHEFRFLAVHPETLDGKLFTTPAVLCARYSDEEFFKNRCKGTEEIYFQQYGRYNIHKIWRDDVLPCRVYLRHCVLAAKNLSDAAYNNFLDHTFVADRKTTIREYLDTTGSGIMEEEPPESLRARYGG